MANTRHGGNLLCFPSGSRGDSRNRGSADSELSPVRLSGGGTHEGKILPCVVCQIPSIRQKVRNWLCMCTGTCHCWMSAWRSDSLQWNKKIVLRNEIVTQVEFYLHGVGESTQVYTQG